MKVCSLEFNTDLRRYLVDLSDGNMYCETVFDKMVTKLFIEKDVDKSSIISINTFTFCSINTNLHGVCISDFKLLRNEASLLFAYPIQRKHKTSNIKDAKQSDSQDLTEHTNDLPVNDTASKK